ncbi:MAG: two-component sensor histidine kinase [Frankiales bacterium]|nr:two-component sensor histidine kinase [Frankiales bacterium]
MTVVLASLAGLLLGAVITGVVVTRRSRGTGVDDGTPAVGARPRKREPMPAEIVLELLPTATVLVDVNDNVRLANASARSLGIVQARSISVPELRQLVRAARLSGKPQSVEIGLDDGGFPRRVLTVGAQAHLLADGDVALVVDDLTEARRVDAVRRDFVANVGHEIKTPVGALTLLAEAALDARDDPEAVHRFVTRMQREAGRLSRLVQELLDLSRLQGGEPLPDTTEVSVDAVLDEAIDRARLVAEVKRIELVRGGDPGLVVTGSESQLVTALSNLLDNAVAYSPAGTRVAVGVHQRPGAVEVAVTDEGIGIEPSDQDRIFERFYRVDPARSRETGGTGLGLAIVKHIVNNHGGEVTVWSRPGAGSTFTIRLPIAPDAERDVAPAGQQLAVQIEKAGGS